MDEKPVMSLSLNRAEIQFLYRTVEEQSRKMNAAPDGYGAYIAYSLKTRLKAAYESTR